jgi:hypothetical protein
VSHYSLVCRVCSPPWLSLVRHHELKLFLVELASSCVGIGQDSATSPDRTNLLTSRRWSSLLTTSGPLSLPMKPQHLPPLPRPRRYSLSLLHRSIQHLYIVTYRIFSLQRFLQCLVITKRGLFQQLLSCPHFQPMQALIPRIPQPRMRVCIYGVQKGYTNPFPQVLIGFNGVCRAVVKGYLRVI